MPSNNVKALSVEVSATTTTSEKSFFAEKARRKYFRLKSPSRNQTIPNSKESLASCTLWMSKVYCEMGASLAKQQLNAQELDKEKIESC